jgi:hypothetical protein
MTNSDSLFPPAQGSEVPKDADTIIREVSDPLNSVHPFQAKEPEKDDAMKFIVASVNIEKSPFPDRVRVISTEGVPSEGFLTSLLEAVEEANDNGVALWSFTTTNPEDFAGLGAIMTALKPVHGFEKVSMVLLDDAENHLIKSALSFSAPIWSEDTLKLRLADRPKADDPGISKEMPTISDEEAEVDG